MVNVVISLRCWQVMFTGVFQPGEFSTYDVVWRVLHDMGHFGSVGAGGMITALTPGSC